MARLLQAGMPEKTKLELVRMTGKEELGRLSHFELEFVSPRPDIKPREVLGRNITWSLELANGEPRYFNGFVTRFSEVGEAAIGTHERDGKGVSYLYRATLNPALWLLKRASRSRIFENMTAVDAVLQVISAYPFSHAQNLSRSYPQRPYIVQYRETDFNFVCRLLEHEGIFFYFEYGNGNNKLVLRDGGGSPTLEVPLKPQWRGATEGDYLESWVVSREIQPGKYTVEDFNYVKPRVPMYGEALDPKDHELASFGMADYGADFDEALRGENASGGADMFQQYAETRLQELQAKYEQFSGSGDVRAAAPGMLLKLSEHDRDEYNKEYLVTAVAYAASAGDPASGGEAGRFSCSVTAIDAKAAFRPGRSTPKPVIQGPQTAIVADWEEPEGLGRVKVQFHWNHESVSCWARVAQPVAGKNWGFLALPRVGHEVVVEFIEGDPDRPLVVGSVYNGDALPPYALPSERSRTGIKTASWGSSGGFNELRFDDKDGAEEIYIRAEKDKTIRIERDRTEYVGNESHLIVKSAIFEKMENDHHVELAGDRNEKLGGSLSLKIDKDLVAKTGTKIAYDAGTEIHLKAGTSIVLEASASLSLKVGGNFITIDPSGVAIKGTMVQINTGGAAGSGSGASPQATTAPKEAHASEGGQASEAPEKQSANQERMTATMGTMPTPSRQAAALSSAAESGAPFCEVSGT